MRSKKTPITLFTLLVLTSVVQADFTAAGNLQGTVSSGATAPAERIMRLTDNSKLEKLLFNFGNAQASLTPRGDWHIEGKVKHQRVRCATYQLGIRFGIGERGCTNVVWVTDFEYGTNVKQCNSATLQHVGGGYIDDLAGNIDEITCAKVDVRCFGKTCNN